MAAMILPMRSVVQQLSMRVIASYIFDWIVILATAGIGSMFSQLEPNQHAFSLIDPAISYPNRPNTVTVPVLLVVSIIVPGVIIFAVSIVFVPKQDAAEGTSQALKWRRKIWEWNTGWMGLALSLAGTFMVTEGLKDLVGKPRPDFLDRCNPDVSLMSQYAVSGLGAVVDNAPIMVDYRICRNRSKLVRNDGFSSWPSGHASMSWAGMLYLTFFLSAKFAIAIPYLAPRTYSPNHKPASVDLAQFRQRGRALYQNTDVPLRNQAAAPPVYLLILAFVPLGTAFFITVSRWFDYRHEGFDVISGAVIGIFFAWFGFRWYHLPIRNGAGWSWGARSRETAFYRGVGIPSDVGDEGWEGKRVRPAYLADPEQGEVTQTKPSFGPNLRTED